MKKVEMWICEKCNFMTTKETKECPACSHNEAYIMPNNNTVPYPKTITKITRS